MGHLPGERERPKLRPRHSTGTYIIMLCRPGKALVFGQKLLGKTGFSHRVFAQISECHLEVTSVMMSLPNWCWPWDLGLSFSPDNSPSGQLITSWGAGPGSGGLLPLLGGLGTLIFHHNPKLVEEQIDRQSIMCKESRDNISDFWGAWPFQVAK